MQKQKLKQRLKKIKQFVQPTQVKNTKNMFKNQKNQYFAHIQSKNVYDYMGNKQMVKAIQSLTKKAKQQSNKSFYTKFVTNKKQTFSTPKNIIKQLNLHSKQSILQRCNQIEEEIYPIDQTNIMRHHQTFTKKWQSLKNSRSKVGKKKYHNSSLLDLSNYNLKQCYKSSIHFLQSKFRSDWKLQLRSYKTALQKKAVYPFKISNHVQNESLQPYLTNQMRLSLQREQVLKENHLFNFFSAKNQQQFEIIGRNKLRLQRQAINNIKQRMLFKYI